MSDTYRSPDGKIRYAPPKMDEPPPETVSLSYKLLALIGFVDAALLYAIVRFLWNLFK